MRKSKPKLSFKADPLFEGGEIWDLYVNGEPQSGWWVGKHYSVYVANPGTDEEWLEAPTMQQAAKLLLKEYKAYYAR